MVLSAKTIISPKIVSAYGAYFGIRLYSDLVEPQGILLHPTQLYEFSALLILFIILFFTLKYKKFDGQVALTYLLIYPVIRSIIEVFRGDLVRGFVIDGFTSQFLSLLIFIMITFLIRFQQIKTDPKK